MTSQNHSERLLSDPPFPIHFSKSVLVLRPLRRSALESESLENAKGIMSASGTLEKHTSSVDSFVDSGSNSPAHARLAKWNVFALGE